MAKKPKRRVVPFQELGDAGDFMEHVDSEISLALVGAAYIENALGSLLMHALIEGETTNTLLNDPNGILSTASGRANICYCIGLITKNIFSNTKNIGAIRNRFAHSHVALNFNDEHIAGLCKALFLPDIRNQQDVIEDLLKDIEDEYRNQQKFVLAVTLTHMSIKTSAFGNNKELKKVERRTAVEHKVRALTGGKLVSGGDPSDPAPIIFFNE